MIQTFVFFFHQSSEILSSLFSDFLFDHSGFQSFVLSDNDLKSSIFSLELKLWSGFRWFVVFATGNKSLLLIISLLSVTSSSVSSVSSITSVSSFVIIFSFLLWFFRFFIERGLIFSPKIDFINFFNQIFANEFFILITPG